MPPMRFEIELATLDLPDFGLPSVQPTLPAEIYRQRLNRLYDYARRDGLDAFVVYADREHFANLAYLTGYDPRFEEALLVLNVGEQARQKPVIMVGNEGWGYVNFSPIKDDLEVVLYQTFSLLGQDRSKSRKLRDILQAAGVVRGARVGTAGWKHFNAQESEAPDSWIDLPAFIVDTLRDLTGSPANVINKNAYLMESSTGLRAINEVEQLAVFEFAATYASQAVRNVIFGVRPGMTEFESVELMRQNGFPLNCHPMLSSGARAFLGLPSPSLKRIERGEAVTVGYGLWGALTCRAGFAVAGPDELPSHIADYAEKLVAPFFGAITAWYEHIGIGVTGGELYRIIYERLGDPFFNILLNPGHLIHMDEWLNSPVYENSTEVLRSGMAIQCDVIPATGTAYFTTNIEDGIALADESLRAEFAQKYPEAWGRIQARRAFMADVLGIRLKPEVLPFSNIQAYLPPFWLAPQRAMRVKR